MPLATASKMTSRQTGTDYADQRLLEQQKRFDRMRITPSNFQLLVGFLDFVGKCPYPLDQDVGELLETVLDIAFCV